ncbi:glycosyltransferase [Crocinitomicaceae bacterium]|nr:glycosyltransferase [Crocinitomicaceae bacterium]
MTDPLGQSQVLPYIKSLSKHGYKFHLISYEKPDRFAKHKKVIQEMCDEDGIVWHPQHYAPGKGLKNTLQQVRRLNKVTFYLHAKHNFDITHCRSYISALAGMRMKSKFGTKFIFDMRGFWADERVDGGLWDLNNVLYKQIYNYFKRKERAFLEEADYVISLTENGKNEMLSWPSTKSDIRIKVIPCCTNLELFDPSKITGEIKEDCRKKVGISKDQFVLGYIGSIGTWYMLPEMMDYFKELQADKPNAQFLFVTGESPERLKKAAEEKGIDPKSISVISVLHHEVPHYISLMSASIFFIKPSYSKKASSPTKQGEIMAMGIPLICNSNVGDTDLIVARYKAGTVIDEFNEATYKNNIINPEAFDSQAIAAGAKDYFALENGVERFLDVYSKIYE